MHLSMKISLFINVYATSIALLWISIYGSFFLRRILYYFHSSFATYFFAIPKRLISVKLFHLC